MAQADRSARTPHPQARATVLWLRQDLRLQGQPALAQALAAGGPVVPVYIWSPAEEGAWAPGAASRAWLGASLGALAEELARRGSRLVLRSGPAAEALARLCRETGAERVVFGRRVEPAGRRQEDAVENALTARGIAVEAVNTVALHEPGTILSGQGGPYRVFTPFSKACLAREFAAAPPQAPRMFPAPARWPRSSSLRALGLEVRGQLAGQILGHWRPGEAGARRLLRRFLDRSLAEYSRRRDLPAIEGTSLLSPHLHFGEIGPGTLWRAVSEWAAQGAHPGRLAQAEAFLRQLLWREFALHLLYHFPRTPEHPLRPEFASFPWSRSRRHLAAWQTGRTGEPFVDAGMRQLAHTGWMHNRARMVAASYLVKDLLLPWQEGARWFWEHLVDADLANNTLGWQWCAGCGADAAPYFRIFHPARQGERFDPAGSYARKWIPELRSGDYPEPIVDHAAARLRALAALASLRRRPAAPDPPAAKRGSRREP